jgi:hypothetical protein
MNSRLITIGDGKASTAGKSVMEKYIQRRPEPSNLALLDFLHNFDHFRLTRRPKAKPRALNYFPRYKAEKNSPQFEDYCRIKVTLHHPFREIKDLLNLDGGSFTN